METMTYTETLPYKVADIKLAEFGRKEIEIADHLATTEKLLKSTGI